MIIWYSVHPYTIFFLKNRAFSMTYLKAVIELGMEQSDELCLGFLWFNGSSFIRKFYFMKTTWKDKTIIAYDTKVRYIKKSNNKFSSLISRHCAWRQTWLYQSIRIHSQICWTSPWKKKPKSIHKYRTKYLKVQANIFVSNIFFFYTDHTWYLVILMKYVLFHFKWSNFNKTDLEHRLGKFFNTSSEDWIIIWIASHCSI